MKHRTSVLTAACTLALLAAPGIASADDDVDCSQEPSGVIRQAVVDLIGTSCPGASPAFVMLEGKLEAKPCSGKGYCREGGHFVQEFTTRDGSGEHVHGHVAVDLHYTRAGFTEWCQESILDCHE